MNPVIPRLLHIFDAGVPRFSATESRNHDMSVSPPSLKKPEVSTPDESIIPKTIYETMTSEDASSYADVTLITSDNVRIPAVRMLLSIRSSYFHKMFSSAFAEKNSSEVSISLLASLLREVLEFIYTDDCNFIRYVQHQMKKYDKVKCVDVVTLIELTRAADYTNVERLASRCVEAIKYVTFRFPDLSCIALQQLCQGKAAWGKQLFQESVQCIEQNAVKALLSEHRGCDLSCGLMHLDKPAAEEVFAIAKKPTAGKHMLFQALVAWASDGKALLADWEQPSWADTYIVIDTGNIEVMGDRLRLAKRIATWFDLSGFKPRFLAEVVERSGLLDQNSLFIAYKTQSIQLEERERMNIVDDYY